jgi:nucleoside-diphosphate-sugar epimerase
MATERKFVLVTGASGWIGRRVCQKLQDRGISVVAFNRVATEGPWIKSFVGGLNCLCKPPEALQELLEMTVAVIHCAGRAHRPIETPSEIAAFTQTNVRGTHYLLEACRAIGVPRLVYVSTIAGYDWTDAPIGGMDEDSRLLPVTAYARTKLEGEQLVRQSDMDWRVLRLSTVFGVGDRANFAKLARALRSNKFIIPGAGSARKSVIPVDLAAEALVQLALTDVVPHRLMNAALPDQPSLREICDVFSAECGFHHAYAMPIELLRFGALFGDSIARWRTGFPLTTVNLEKLTSSTIVNTTRLYQTLPSLPRSTFAESLRAAAKFYRNV